MDVIQLDFDQAKAKHLLFKSKLRSILYGEMVEDNTVVSEYDCLVGKWIYGHALKTYSYIPETKDLEKVHADIHHSARNLISLYNSGQVELARAGLTEMEMIADHLVSLLEIMEQKVKQENRDIAPETDLVFNAKQLDDLLKANERLDKIIKAQSGEIANERKILHDFFIQAPALFAILKGPESVFELANPLYLEMVGKRDLIGKPVRQALPELEGQGFFELLENVYKTGETFSARETPVMIIKDGKLKQVYVDFSYQPYRDSSNNVQGILVFAYEVTEMVESRKLIEESNERARFISESMPQVVWTADKKGNINYFNQKLMEYTGMTFEDLKEWGWKVMIHPEDLEENLRLWQHSIDTGTNFQYEHRFRKADGEYRWHLGRGIPQKDEQGNVIRWVGTNTDIHDLKKVEEKLKQAYEDMEVKIKFRNIELERENALLKAKING